MSDKSTGRSSLRDLLKDWPYSRDYLLDTIDADLIERHAVMHLSRALNIGTVVAFLGAGVSMAYGRISWKNLVTELKNDAMKGLDALEPNTEKRKLTLPRLQTLHANLNELNFEDRPPGGDMRSDRYPSVFQLCAELSVGVAAEKAARANATEDRRQGDDAFLAGVKARTRDGHFHALRLLATHLADGADPAAVERLTRRFIDTIYGKRPGSRQELFQRRNIADWMSGAHEDTKAALATFLAGPLGASPAGHPPTLKPSLRFLLPAALAYHKTPWPDVEAAIGAYLERDIATDDAGPRRDARTQAGADVIETLRSRLKIRRYLTTNYDLELERLIFDLDFEPMGEADRGITRSADPLGRMARDFVVSRDAPAALVDFATREGTFTLDVAHLHGRALPGEPIVAAETQYQEFYLRDDGHRDLLDQALVLAFRSNTLLFVGNGMGEDDILRPLRHFMSEGSGPTQPPAVALLPDLWGKASVLEEKISLLRRYGVYAIHWGRGRVDGMAEADSLLPEIKKLIGAIRGILKVAAGLKNGAEGLKPVAAAIDAWNAQIAKGKAIQLVDTGRPSAPVLRRLVEIEGAKADDGAVAPAVMQLEWAALGFALSTAAECRNGLAAWAEDARAAVAAGSALPAQPAINAEQRAALVVAEEIEDAILAAMLGAKVDQIARDWAKWRSTWFPAEVAVRLAAPPKQPLGAPPPPGGTLFAPSFRIDRRHALALKTTAASAAGGGIGSDRDFRPPFSQTYAEFLRALKATISPGAGRARRRAWTFRGDGRRVYFLAGRRGLGKGHLFSALTHEDGFGNYAQIVAQAAATKPMAPFYGLYAMNLSFSVEIGSAFDRLAEFLFMSITDMVATNSAMAEDAKESFRQDFERDYRFFVAAGSRTTGDRVGAIRFLMDVLAKGAAALRGGAGGEKPAPITHGRVAIAINAAHLLFNQRGFAKSAEIQRLVSALLDPGFDKANVDIFLIGSEARLPAEIRGAPQQDAGSRSPPGIRRSAPAPRLGAETAVPPLTVAPIAPVERSVFDRTDDEAAITALGLRILPDTGVIAPGQAPLHKPGLFFHRIQQPRISVVLMTAFPRVALALARAELWARAQAPTLTDLLTSFDKAELARLDRHDSAFFTRSTSGPATNPDRVRLITREDVAEYLATVILGTLEPALAREIDRRFGRLYKDLGRSRLCVSIVCAAADEAIARRIGAGGSPQASVGACLKAGEVVIDRLAKALGGSDEAHREDTVIRAVIEHYREEMDSGWLGEGAPLTADTLFGTDVDAALRAELVRNFAALAGDPRELGRILFRLDEEVLAALAMIGQPVEADCLAALNFQAFRKFEQKIRKFEQKIRKKDGSAAQPDTDAMDGIRQRLCEHALDRLVRRCLAFRFTSRSTDVAGNARHRFGVHRLVQRHVFRRMHQPRVEFPEISNFMPTLFAHQPNDLPYPSSEAREAIRDMMVRLSFYPSRRRLGQSGGLPDIRPERASRMLRAAYGVARSVLSLAVVTRFDSYLPAVKPPPHGFIEEHRHGIRWLTRRAVVIAKDLDDARKKAPSPPDAEDAFRRSLPFFAGDLVWLHNECGVLSLAQGRLPDAAKLFSVALRAVQRIEAPTVGGAQTNIIRLNRAIVDIEIGKCGKADEALKAIAATPDENRAVRWTAHGYRGLVAHILGDAEAAKLRYTEAVEALRVMQRYRGASIFARHLADIHRRERRPKEALEAAETAVTLASIGNHADVYQLARITRLRAQVASKYLGADPKTPELTEIQKTLKDVADYARIMGMPRIAVEAEHLDASIRFELGDLHYANASVTRALALANENGMILKKVALTILVARIYCARGLRDDGRLLAENARDLAIATQYATAQDEAQDILARL